MERKEPAVGKPKIDDVALDAIHCIDAISGLKKLDDDSIDCVMTSPPYCALRDYEVDPIVWGGDSKCKHLFVVDQHEKSAKENGSDVSKPDNANRYTAAYNVNKNDLAICARCEAWQGSLGLEPSFDLYLAHLLLIFDEVKRVLKPKGTLWVNLSDTYPGSWGSFWQTQETRHRRQKSESSSWPRRAYADSTFRPPSSNTQVVPRRSLCQIPARFSIAMADHGWILRNDIIWHKPNHMPASVKNRFCNSWEHLLFFVKSEKYYFDLDAVREPHKSLQGKPLHSRPASSRYVAIANQRLSM